MNDKGDSRASSSNGGGGERVDPRRRGPGRRKAHPDARLAAPDPLEATVDAFAREITHHKAEERRLTLLAGLGEKIRTNTVPDDLLYDVAVMVGQHFGVRRCLFNEIDLENDVEIVRRDYVDRAESVAGSHKVSAYSPASSAEMAAGKTVVNNDSKVDRRTAKLYKRTYGPAGERSYVAVPLMRDRQWVASLWVSTDEPRVWTPSEVGTLEMIAERAWLAAERLRNDAAMRASQERFARFMDNLPGLAWVKSADGRYVFANEPAAAAFNVPAERLIGKTDDEIFPPETAAAFKENDQKVIKRKKSIQTIESLVHDDGTLHYSIVNKFPIPGPNGEPALVGGMAIDITEQRRAEEEIRQISRMPAENPSPVMRITPDGEILYANDPARPLLDFWQRESGVRLPREIRIRLHEAFRVGIKQEFEIDFDDRTLIATIAPITDAGYINFYATDITDRKRAEEKLRKKEAELQLIADTTPLILARCSRDLRYQFINKAGADLLGLPVNKIVGRSIVDIIGKEAFVVIEPHVRQVLAGKRVEYEGQVPYKTGVKWMRVNYVPEFAEDGTVTGWLASIVDITERKEAEEQLTEAQERFRLAQQAGQVGIFDWHIQAGRTYWSEAMWTMYGIEQDGINPDELFWRAHLHPADRDRVLENLRGSVDSSDGEYREEFRILRGDGVVRWVGATGRVIRDGHGRPHRMFGVNIDITERKQAEESLRRSQNQLRLITDGLPALISYVNRDERYVYANRTYTEWFGIDPQEIVGRPVKSVFGISAYRKLKASIDNALAGREARFEALIPYKKGGPRYVVGTYVPDVGADGKVRGYFGLTNDLSDLKRSQEMLRSSEDRLGLLMETFTDYAIISLDREGRVESWNTGAEHIFGYSRDEMTGHTCDRLFTAEDLAENVPLKEMHQARLRGRASDERWLVRKDGSRFFASGVMMPLYVGKTLAGYAKIAGDLTEKQRQAELLKQAHDVLEERVAQRTRELAASNAALLTEIDQRAAAEKQRIDLLGRLVSSQEFERRRIARDLHDQLGQRLTALRLKLASLADAVDGNTPIAGRVARLQEIGGRLDTEVSFLAWELRPSALDDLGLVDAVGAYVNEWSRHFETPAEFHTSGLSGERFDHNVETHLYRVTQEALNNVAKHAEAERVSVLLERMAENLVLIIEDDGKGFDLADDYVPTESGRGLGLTGMKERAALIGGDIEIESAAGKGTTIYVRVPVFE